MSDATRPERPRLRPDPANIDQPTEDDQSAESSSIKFRFASNADEQWVRTLSEVIPHTSIDNLRSLLKQNGSVMDVAKDIILFSAQVSGLIPTEESKAQQIYTDSLVSQITDARGIYEAAFLNTAGWADTDKVDDLFEKTADFDNQSTLQTMRYLKLHLAKDLPGDTFYIAERVMRIMIAGELE